MWIYKQSTGALSRVLPRVIDETVCVGYAGCGEGKNNPAMQNVHNVGPLPCGLYRIGPPYNTQGHGPFVLPLTPDKANTMFGRSGFLIHGDSIKEPGTASQGCIIMPRAIREQIHASKDDLLRVVS